MMKDVDSTVMPEARGQKWRKYWIQPMRSVSVAIALYTCTVGLPLGDARLTRRAANGAALDSGKPGMMHKGGSDLCVLMPRNDDTRTFKQRHCHNLRFPCSIHRQQRRTSGSTHASSQQ